MKEPYKMNLQLFSDSGVSVDSSSGSEPTVASDGGATAGVSEKTFTQAQVDAIVAQRLGREKELGSQFKARLTELGYGNLDELAQAVPHHHSLQESGMPPAQLNAPDNSEAERMLMEAKILRAQTALEAAAMKSGLVESQALTLLSKIVDLSDVKVENGVVDSGAIQTKLTQALEQYPILKASSAFSGGGNPGTSGNTTEAGQFGSLLGKEVAQNKQLAGNAFEKLFKR